MSAINQIHLSTASNYGKQAGFLASRCRDKKVNLQQIELLLEQWRRIFSLSEVIVLGAATLALILVDIILMMPLYLQTAQVIEFGDPEILKIPIGAGVNILAIVASEKLAKCFDTGAFYKWELWKRHEKADALTHYDTEVSRLRRILQFMLAFGLFLAVILMMLWIRSIVVGDSELIIKKMELPISLMGICFSLVTVMIGVYVLPFLQYLFWSGRAGITNWQIASLIHKVSNLDNYAYTLWRHNGTPTDIIGDLRDALIRCIFRTKDSNYCETISLQEHLSFEEMLRLLKTGGDDGSKNIEGNIG